MSPRRLRCSRRSGAGRARGKLCCDWRTDVLIVNEAKRDLEGLRSIFAYCDAEENPGLGGKRPETQFGCCQITDVRHAHQRYRCVNAPCTFSISKPSRRAPKC
ncbi:hypothetical protein MPLA_750078 [Mesorhizobium sp. ORS 3359]|nr:hypothetical protein MPLA_750078 [Mesorhizobium sp. ORS 3359]